MRGFTIAAIITAALVLLLREPLALLLGGGQRRGDEGRELVDARAHAGRGSGVAARPSDPANQRVEWVEPGASLEHMRELAEQALALDGLTRQGGATWVATRLALVDPRQRELFDRCATGSGEREREPARACEFVLTRVLARSGRVEYAKVDHVPDVSPGCAAMAACIVEARLGESIPLPPEHDDHLAVAQWVDARQLPSLDDPGHLDDMVALLEDDLEAAREEFGDSRDHEGDYLFSFAAEQASVDYLRERAERLRRGGS